MWIKLNVYLRSYREVKGRLREFILVFLVEVCDLVEYRFVFLRFCMVFDLSLVLVV